LNDKLARWAIRSEKTAGHDLRSEDGRKSRVEDFKCEVFRILRTSEGVTGGREYRVEPASGGSGNTKDGERRLS
jgi:hypothetical protein